jgi:diacylglycerol kinase (ATP)
LNNYKFVVNPAAACGKCAKQAKILKELCQDRNLDFEMTYTEKPNDATEIARAATANFKYIIAVGGDGTIYETVNGLMDGRSVFGVVPIGSGNDFIRPLNIPLKMTDALDTIIKGNTAKIDIGKAGEKYFSNGLGVGFDAWAVEHSKHITKLRGSAIYLYAVLKTIYNYQSPEMKLKYNDVERGEKIFMLTAGNGISLGGGFKLTPNAIMDDGLLDLNIVSDLTKLQIYQNLLSVYSGTHTKMPQVSTARTTNLSVESEQGFAVHLDGELMSLEMNSLNISIIPKALDVIVP